MRGTAGALVLAVALVATMTGGCGGEGTARPPAPAAPGLLGAWTYRELYPGGTYDAGTITFVGDGRAGDYVVVNFYKIEYRGTYEVKGAEVALAGAKSWTGRFASPDRLEGTWLNEGARESWEATRGTSAP